MVTIHLGATDLARTRFAFSPLWEAVAGFRAWQLGAPHLAALDWSSRLRTFAPRESWRWLRLVALAPSGRIPDFLAPPPPDPFSTFEAEAARLQATSLSVVRAELREAYAGALPPGAPRTRHDCAAFLEGVGREIALFWRWTLAPLWPRLRGQLEAEVVYRSRILAFGGVTELFRGLHPAIQFQPRRAGGVLRIRSDQRAERRAAGMGLLLVPSMFAWPDVYVVARQPWRPTLAYPARGVAEVWELSRPSGRMDAGPLPALLGASRARMLQALQTPQTTTALSSMLRLSPATVSQHLSALHLAAVLDRARVGRHVYYVANALGQEMLGLFDRR
jgi:DNA-binding transcriptional ArsR family regulator